MHIETNGCKTNNIKSEKRKRSDITILSGYIKILVLRNYNESTIKTYQQHLKRFLNFFSEIDPEDIPFAEIRQYILYLVEEKKCSAAVQNNTINAIKVYYNNVINKPIDEFYIPRPRRAKTMPKILNELEVSRILKSIYDLRDKCMIFLIYSAGLSPSEVIYLKITDIDSDKMRIFISSAKGNKNRYVILSDKLLKLLREYFKKYRPRKWLFENYSGIQYSKRSLQKAFQLAVKKSGINKPATLTIMKNSFAVHLLEKGVDVRYIQQILGHKHSKTTMKYLRVSKRDLSAIQSPLDSLDI